MRRQNSVVISFAMTFPWDIKQCDISTALQKTIVRDKSNVSVVTIPGKCHAVLSM